MSNSPANRQTSSYLLVLGALLIIVSAGLGYTVNTLFYAGIAVGLVVTVLGTRKPAQPDVRRPSEIVDPDLDQTCELNYRPE